MFIEVDNVCILSKYAPTLECANPNAGGKTPGAESNTEKVDVIPTINRIFF